MNTTASIKKVDQEAFVNHPAGTVKDASMTTAVNYLSVQEACTIINEDQGAVLQDIDTVAQLHEYGKQAADPDLAHNVTPEQGRDLIAQICPKVERFQDINEGIATLYKILIGETLNAMKAQVQSRGEKWEAWTNNNINFISDRTRQKHMKLAKVKKAGKYAAVGEERLLNLGDAVKGKIGDDPIEEFLGEYKVTFSPQSSLSIAELKNQIDAALVMDKATAAKIELDFDLVKKLINQGYKIKTSDLEDLKRLQQNGSDPNAYLEKLLSNGGKTDRLFVYEKKLEGFKELGGKINKMASYLIGTQNVAKDLQPSDIQEVIDTLEKLKAHLAGA